MQKIDYRSLVTDDPVADAEAWVSKRPDIVGYCETCGSPIYKGLDFINLQTVLLHDEYECKIAWLNQFKENG